MVVDGALFCYRVARINRGSTAVEQMSVQVDVWLVSGGMGYSVGGIYAGLALEISTHREALLRHVGNVATS